MEATIAGIVAEIAEFRSHNPTNSGIESQSPAISDSCLSDLQILLDQTFNDDDSEAIDTLYEKLSSKNLSPSSLIPPIASVMDSGPTHLSLFASHVYLSLLLYPNSPVFTLFSPVAFLSLLRSIRRSIKNRPTAQTGSSQGPANRKKNRARGGGLRKCDPSSYGEDCDGGEESEFVMRALFPVLEKLQLVTGLIHLDRFPDSLKSLVQTVAEIPVIGFELCGNSGNYNKLIDLCSSILREVLKPEHGDEANTAAEVLKSLSSMILQPKSHAGTFALGFVKKEMMEVAKDSDGVRKAILNLPKYLAQKAPEKSEPRALAVESITEIVRVMELQEQTGFVEYVLKMTQGKANLRLLAVDLIPMLVTSLADPLRDSCGMNCLKALIQCCSDVIAGIRARALLNLSEVVGILTRNDRGETMLKESMGFVNLGKSEMVDLLRERCMDEKAAVRKAALVLVSKLTALFGSGFDGSLLKAMGVACSDPLVSIRKAAISALSEAFRKFPDESVSIEWLHSVPCLINDNESSIQEECENLFLELVLDRISRAGSVGLPKCGSKSNNYDVKAKSSEIDDKVLFPEGVLGLLEGICNEEVSPWVKKICTSLGKKKRLKQKVANALQHIIQATESLWLSHSLPIRKWTAPPGAWFLLSEVSAYLAKAVDWEFLHHHWQLLDNDDMGGEVRSPLTQGEAYKEEEGMESNSVAWAGDRVFLLQTISNVSLELPPEPAADLAHNLFLRVKEFNMHSTEVNAHVKALRTLCKRKASNQKEADALVMKWVYELLCKASQILKNYISEDSEGNTNSIFSTPRSGTKKSKKAKALSRSLSRAVIAVYTIGSVVMICPSADTRTIIPLLHTVITSGNSDPKLKRLPGSTESLRQKAPLLYNHAWLTLGKICLADEKLAKRYIPLFVQELEKSDCAAIRNNLVVTMADFCIRYTALVDCYITKITKCLRDPCELVRRQTFILLSRLLQRDYVKWRGVLFLRFLLALVDESEKIRQLADYLFGNILKVKAPLLAYNSFIEAIFVLNDCHAHNGHSDSHSSNSENRLFSIRGNDEKSRSKRMNIYVCLLKQMAPEHLLATFAKLCAEILAAASDGALNIADVTGQSVLQDAFQILACKEIRIPTHHGSSSDSADIDEEGDSGASTSGGGAAAARGRAVTQAVKKGLVQNMIPIFIELKRLLESKNSPLIGSLMECLRVLLKDYKNEIDDILVADKQLQKEIMYDMHKYETAKAKSAAAEAVASNKRATSFNSPKVANGKQVTSTGDARLASAMADANAAATARSVLEEVNRGKMTPPLSSLKMPKLKSAEKGCNSGSDRPSEVIESLRKRLDSD
ncbi:uncharacterized protein LOC107433135 [Ziziphus jujuba]|uniref:Uncharacterized protein LOC107433135 n=1 Tax=Ziziphus jujuba TaxID=326968 RepID=A0A6P4BL95_ZIZJJ|nr:uncharacterized protein LOC107433135 [Ziziphus jujuba]